MLMLWSLAGPIILIRIGNSTWVKAPDFMAPKFDDHLWRTLEIATRCGQDSDCNPSNALAVLGVVKGLNGLPVDYKNAVEAIGDSVFINTNYSFNKAVTSTVKYAKDLVVQNGGTISDTKLKIKVQSPQPFPLEKSFPKLVFDRNVSVFENGGWEFKGKWEIKGKNQSRFSSNAGDEAVFTFDGTGVSICGNWFRDCGKADVFVDGKLKRTIDGYFWFANQSPTYMELYHITNLQQGKHVVKVVVRGEKRPEASAANLYISKAVVFKTADKKMKTSNSHFSNNRITTKK